MVVVLVAVECCFIESFGRFFGCCWAGTVAAFAGGSAGVFAGVFVVDGSVGRGVARIFLVAVCGRVKRE